MDTKQIMAMSDLLAIEVDTVYEEVYIPEWKKTIRLGTLTADMAIEWAEGNEKPELKKIGGLRLLVASMVDEHGARIAADDAHRDAMVAALRKRNAEVITRLTKRAVKLNGMGVEAEADRKNALSEASTPASPTA